MTKVLPAILIEKYYECFPNDFDNFINSVGIVGGTIDLFMVIGLLFIIPTMASYLWLARGERPMSVCEMDERDGKEMDDFKDRQSKYLFCVTHDDDR